MENKNKKEKNFKKQDNNPKNKDKIKDTAKTIAIEELNKEEKENYLIKKIEELNRSLTETNLLEVLELLGKKRRMLWLNLIAGISRGIGIGIGVTIITAILVIILQKIVTLNIPVIGEYIADIVEIVQKSR